MNPAEAFLYDQVPLSLQSMIPTTLKTAYAAADDLISGEPILQVQSAEDNGGRIVQWAVDLAFQRPIENGQWPFDFRWQYFAAPTGRYLEIRPSHSVMTISQVADPRKQPRDVCFRANKRLRNQGWLRGLPNPYGEGATSGVPHILLTHGYQTLNFAYLGIPHDTHHLGYQYRTPNIMQMPREASTPVYPIEDTDHDAVMSLKDEIDKWRRDNDGQGS